jgi:hypothetical protein
MRFIDSKTDDAHDNHCCDVQPCHFEPLAKTWPCAHIHDHWFPSFAMARRCISCCSTMLMAAEDAHGLNLQEFSLKLHNNEIDVQMKRIGVLKSQFVICDVMISAIQNAKHEYVIKQGNQPQSWLLLHSDMFATKGTIENN